MKQTLLLTLLLAVLFSCVKKDYSEQTKEASFNQSKLDSLLDILYLNDKFMGSVSLSHDGTTIYSKAIGYDDIETQKVSSTETKYRIGSISKMFTATLVFKAIEEHKINIEQTIDKFIPEIENAHKITIGNLLNHRSGIHNFTKDEAFLSYRTQFKSPQEMV